MKKLDWTKLKAAIAADTKQLRALKADGYHGDALASEKLEATLHHAIAAHTRSKIHLSGKFLCNPHWLDSMKYGPWFTKSGMTRDEQAKFIDKELQKFLIEVPDEPKTEVLDNTVSQQ
jgi:hypothetical protein